MTSRRYPSILRKSSCPFPDDAFELDAWEAAPRSCVVLVLATVALACPNPARGRDTAARLGTNNPPAFGGGAEARVDDPSRPSSVNSNV